MRCNESGRAEANELRCSIAMLNRKPPIESLGSEPDPRFSYANERTFLAWNRTALALVAAGLAATSLLPPFNVPGGRRLIGVPLIVLGAVLAAVSYRRWDANERAMRLRQPLPPSHLGGILAAGIALAALIAAVVALLGTET
jgi:putative membrane protein